MECVVFVLRKTKNIELPGEWPVELPGVKERWNRIFIVADILYHFFQSIKSVIRVSHRGFFWAGTFPASERR